MKRNMVGKRYMHSKLGIVEVIKQPNYKAGGPHNVLVRLIDGEETIVPQRSLRKLAWAEETTKISKEITMKRHQNKWLSLSQGADLDSLIELELYKALERYGPFASAHELAATLREEFEEFWDSVKAQDPDPGELLQICAVAKRGIIELCQQARDEMKTKEEK